ncbi:hypothetical protein H310_00373 [Aphanomyces invadans]|uniref:Uncharacterized protein n=1 Tax=Aphanomyces invadans TaxID=157072 RepID=A0A024UVL7_9STRA|nr:hypothetical protein H310_00373 [Aphanomyces invadans]ETW09952.1 hypothetical protein H310_00373 [Aphanomyces invadans]|eukprot:XP_008861363.1 hypothetical protein H310_00373 [Aphanomyces invadans]
MGGIHTFHQLCMSLCALVGIGGAGYAVATTSFDFHANALQSSIVQILLLGGLFALSFLLFLATALGAALPVRWFGMMGSFTGSGIYAIYLGLLVSHHVDNIVGTTGTFMCIAVGIASALYGLAWREKDSSGYSAFV